MRLLRFIPIQLTLFLGIGIVLGNFLDLDIIFPVIFTMVLLFSLGVLFYMDFRKTTTAFAFMTGLLALNIGILAISLAQQKNLPNYYSKAITKENQLLHLKIIEILKPTSFSTRYIAKLVAVENQPTRGRLLLGVRDDSLRTPLAIDDELILQGTPVRLKAALNPHQFEYASYMSNLGVSDQIVTQTSGFILLPNASKTIYGRAAALRHTVISKLRKVDFGDAELSVIQALLLGQRNDISEATYTDYKNAGAVHILAVSGLHIGILLLILQFVFKPLELFPKGKTIKLMVIVILLWAFALLAGFSASIVRAVTMFSFVAYALYLNRPSNTFNILALSMFFILLVIDPRLLFQVGFQMSYAAVFAIIWIYPLLQRFWYPKNIVVRKVWQLLSVSMAAQVGVLPISLYYFHQFPSLFFISNLMIVPALGIILGLGVLVIILAVCDILPALIVTIYNTLIRWMNQIVSWVAQQESFVFQNISFDAVQMVLAYALLIAIVLLLTRPSYKKAIIAAIAVIGFQGYLFHAAYRTKKLEQLWLLHQTANSVLLQQLGTRVTVFSKYPSETEPILANYQVAERTTSVRYQALSNSYQWLNKTMLVIDSTGIYPTKGSTDYLILTGSPKINLERLIDSLRPKHIIADGSNYRSYTIRWKKTCLKKELPFHYTGEKGAYKF